MKTAVRRKTFEAEAHLVMVDGEPWYEWTPETAYNFDKLLKGWRVRVKVPSPLPGPVAFTGFPREAYRDGATITVSEPGAEPVVDGDVDPRVIRALRLGTGWGGRPSTEEDRIACVREAIRFYAQDHPVSDISRRWVAGRCQMLDVNHRPTRPFTKLVAKFGDWDAMKEWALREGVDNP